ncbi:MAG TPA: hypothetical protein VKU44_05125 [Terriglobia bacterium]|nr:hypothetical protein [Terriglobia bacterium]
MLSWKAASFAALAVALGAGLAQTKERKPASPPPSDLPARVNDLARKLIGVPLDESDPITSQIEKLVVDHFQTWLEKQPPGGDLRDVPVRVELEGVFAKLHYPVYGWPAVFARPWKGGTLVGVGYTLGWSDYDRVNVMALFEARQGRIHLAAVDRFVPHTDLHYEFMSPPPSGDFWFVAYGKRLGKSQPRLTAALYSFDGQSLKSVWQVRDAYDGRISVGPNWVTIRSLREDEYIRETEAGRKPPRYESIYMATPSGLQLQSERTIPF